MADRGTAEHDLEKKLKAAHEKIQQLEHLLDLTRKRFAFLAAYNQLPTCGEMTREFQGSDTAPRC